MKLIRPQTDQVISVRTAPGNLTPNISENWKVYECKYYRVIRISIRQKLD